MNKILSDYPDIITTILIPMIIAIFAFGFPLLIQTITRIDDKYKSTKLIKTFRADWICKWFIWSLVCSIISYIVWLFQIPPFIDLGWFVDNSALILLIVATISLIVMTFFIVYLTYVYYIPELLLIRLIKQYDNNKKETIKILNLQAISKILNYSIQTVDEPLAEKLWEFYFSKIFEFRKFKENQEVVYSKEYYYTFLEANELLCEQNKRAISRFNNNNIFDLFLDGNQQTIISQDTYSFLWKLIIQSLHYNRVDFVISYWRKAHQLFDLFMKKIHPEYDNSYIEIKNQIEIDKREKERKDFLDFHYALGGLLMYKQKYEVVSEIMYYTQQQPPKYVLVPEKMQDVIERYMQIDQNEYLNPVYYEQRYQFPDIQGVNSDGMIRMWIKRYLAILFIRQYTLHEYYINSQLLTMPQPPEELSELNRWKEELNSLEYFINDYLSQKKVLNNLGLGKLYNSNWFDDNKKETPTILIENFKKQIDDKFDKIKKDQPIAKTKEKDFQEKTVLHLTPIFNKYQNIFSNKEIINYQSHFIGGRKDILDKTAFAENQDVAYINTNSITAQGIGIEFEYYATNTLILMSPQKYFLMENDVFLAIDKLNIDPKNFVIISVGLNLKYFSRINEGLRSETDEWYYNGIKIIELGNYNNDLASQSLFIMKIEDLPNIVFKPTSTDIRDEYGLDKIDSTYNIYAKLVDLSNPNNKKIKERIEQKNNLDDLSKSVLSFVNINAEIQYKPKVKCIQIRGFSQFDDRGKANRLEDIEEF
jgi:hypothetical protein